VNLWPRRQEWPCAQRYLLAVALVYVVLYGSLLLKTDALPYVMDNNESFSSLWHAANLYEFGAAQSYGLADEAISPDAAAHPYVHTHQGNFPRLFAFLIYAAGARTIETQIAVTTMVVGLPAIILMYLFFARIASPAFGALASVVFMTDYVLFAQWQVVTYRVWHCFLLFLCLYGVHRATEDSGRRWLVVTLVAFACLFYFELVFAALVAAWCGSYALVLAAKRPRRLMEIGVAATAGMLLALAAVIAQAVAYLGFDDFRRDIYLTFVARNDFSSVSSLIEEAARFYESRRIVFWHNLQDREAFSGLAPFLRSFTAFDWRVHTPPFAVAIWVLAAGWLLGLRPPPSGAMRRRVFLGIVCLGLFLGALVLVLYIDGTVFGAMYAPIWKELYELAGPRVVLVLVLFAATLVALHMALGGGQGVAGDFRARPRQVLVFLICGAFAYTLVYAISPGYVYSGYLARNAPFTVFLTDVVVALGLYVAILAAIRLTRRAIALEAASPAALYLRSSFAGITLLLVAFLFGYWLLMQVSYMGWMPPSHYAFLKKLAQPPYRGASFVVNTYAAPVAAYTGQWAYFDPAISHAAVVRHGRSVYLTGDNKYLWFADRDANESYRKPDYFVCMIAQDPLSIVNRILRDTGLGPGQPGCSQLSLVRQARDLEMKGVSLVERDEAGFERIGFDSWAIVKLDWNGSPMAGIDWSARPMRQVGGPEKPSWRATDEERLQKHAIVFHVPVLPEAARHREILAVPGYAALVLENNGLHLTLSNKMTVADRETVQIKAGYLRYAGQKGDVYTYHAGVRFDAGVGASEINFPVEVDISRMASGVAVIRVYPPLAKFVPDKLLDSMEFKLQTLMGLEPQKKLLGYLDRLTEEHRISGRGFDGVLEAIAFEAYNSPGRAPVVAGFAPERLSDKIVLLAVLATWLIGFPIFLLFVRARRMKDAPSRDVM
jgi:hypothetical protein